MHHKDPKKELIQSLVLHLSLYLLSYKYSESRAYLIAEKYNQKAHNVLTHIIFHLLSI